VLLLPKSITLIKQVEPEIAFLEGAALLLSTIFGAQRRRGFVSPKFEFPLKPYISVDEVVGDHS
jgi:hypothetical protein